MTYPTPNSLKSLWEKWGQKYVEEKFKIYGIKRTPRYTIFAKKSCETLDEMLGLTIEKGEDYKTILGTFLTRQVVSPVFRGKKYGRNFEIIGGREYTIFDLLKKGNKYPIFTFRNDGLIAYRNWMWRAYSRPSVKWRKRLYKKFYDEGGEYKTMRYPNKEQAKRKRQRVIWRNNMKLEL